MRFEWDPRKSARNDRKHGVTFRLAATVFGDPLSRTFADEDHSVSEDRWLIVGAAVDGRWLVVSYTDRADRIRIISARELTPSERRAYERRR